MSTYDVRDLRSTAVDAKRFREQKEKWSAGSRPLPGRLDTIDALCFRQYAVAVSPDDDGKVRPRKQPTNFRHHAPRNASKPLRTTTRLEIPQSHFRARMDARVQVLDPNNLTDAKSEDLLAFGNHKQLTSPTDPFLYSFDRTDTPGKPLSLELFVKSNPRATEKLVEKEYEILDSNGDALKGRRARNNLRRRDNTPSEESTELAREDDGFELI